MKKYCVDTPSGEERNKRKNLIKMDAPSNFEWMKDDESEDVFSTIWKIIQKVV